MNYTRKQYVIEGARDENRKQKNLRMFPISMPQSQLHQSLVLLRCPTLPTAPISFFTIYWHNGWCPLHHFKLRNYKILEKINHK